MLENIRIVLCETSHAGNIGAAARAMKTMGLSNLALVKPNNYPSAEATARASSADDVLFKAGVYDTVSQAIADSALVIGTSARVRTMPVSMLSPRQMAEKVAEEVHAHPVAILFGRENSGLTNEELGLCHFHCCIPANPEYSSLNLAAAVQLLSYELRLALLEQDIVEEQFDVLASAEQVQGLLQHFEQVMVDVDFYDPDKPKLLMPRLTRLLNRARLEVTELNILRGFLTHIIKKLKTKTGQ